MSEPNLEIVRRSFDAFNRGDLKAVQSEFAPEFEFEPSGRFMDTKRVYSGPDEFEEFWNAFRAAWEEITVEVARMEEVDDRVLTLGTFRGSGGGSGAVVEGEAAWIHKVRNGRIVHLQSFATWDEALEVVGLSD